MEPWSCHGVKGTTPLPLDLRADLLRDPLHVPRDLTAKVLRQGHERDRNQHVPITLRPEVDPQAGVQTTLELAHERVQRVDGAVQVDRDRKSTRLNSSHVKISYAVFCLKK